MAVGLESSQSKTLNGTSSGFLLVFLFFLTLVFIFYYFVCVKQIIPVEQLLCSSSSVLLGLLAISLIHAWTYTPLVVKAGQCGPNVVNFILKLIKAMLYMRLKTQIAICV